MYHTGFMILFIVIIKVNSHEDRYSIVDVKSLSLLPLDGLLNIKKNLLDFVPIDDDHNSTATDENTPSASPLIGLNKKSSDVHYDEDKYEKKSVNKIFQSSVTSLAFLAFGGYLLFLVITAIKNKPQYYPMYDPNNTQIMQAMLNSEIHRRKKKKKPIKGNSYYSYKEDEEDDSMKKMHKLFKQRNLSNELEIDNLYQGLIDLCEGYRKILD
ncbi:hypothetical protein ABEB36_005265 [Hypothenemus hampei]|uniref:Uncharacterized protein n=1 Tax=Hypothenemus hampei TaxID=57062 RepID=A0ABD1F1G4_HYPHA